MRNIMSKRMAKIIGLTFRKMLVFCLLALCSVSVFASSTSDLENRQREIDAEIQQRRDRTKSIDREKKSINDQLKDIEKELNKVEKERRDILRDIDAVTKNIAYGEQNLGVTSNALTSKKNQYSVKVNAWDRYVKLNGDNPKDAIMRKEFKNLLFGDLDRIDHIQTVESDIKKVTTNIEEDRKKLTALRSKLEANKKSIDKNRTEKNRLIAQLNRERQNNNNQIQRLLDEKKRIQAQISNVIDQYSKTKKSDTSSTGGITPSEQMTTVPAVVKRIGWLSKPLAGDTVVRFGDKKAGIVESNGIEIQSHMGAQVKAAANGTVVFSGKFQGLTNVVMIDYGYDLVGVYGNLISCRVGKGEKVSRGQVVGTLGKSSEGEPNLYYEVRFKNKLVNPAQCFK